MGNVALNKNATSSEYIAPFSAQKAVDGQILPTARWLCKTVPGWMMVDLGAYYWINRWVVKHMGLVGWSPAYNMVDFKLQKSLDNVTWTDADSVAGNSSNNTDRPVAPFKARYLRVYVTKGLNANNGTASIVEFEAYDMPPTSQYLSGLTISSGTLTPAFGKNTYSYTASVLYDTAAVTVTPTGEDSYSTITVNGTAVQSGQASQPVSLNVGQNTITVHVVAGAGGAMQDYTIAVARGSSPYLQSVTMSGMRLPTFVKTQYSYSVSTTVSSTVVTATAEDASANVVISLRGTNYTSGQSLTLNPGNNEISIKVTAATGGDIRTYIYNVNKTA